MSSAVSSPEESVSEVHSGVGLVKLLSERQNTSRARKAHVTRTRVEDQTDTEVSELGSL